jgi:two-component system, OmpR family, sensor histidine kinase TctE
MSSRPADSLRVQLLRWLLPPLLVLLLVNAWSSNRAAVATADMAFDRLLMASAEAIAEDVEFKDGELVVDLPYAALELLESNLQERIFYRVLAPDGKTVTGYEDLPLPDAATPRDADSALYAARYRGETIHLVALNKKFYGTGLAAPVIIVVAETGEARDALSRQILVEGLARQAMLIAAAALLVWYGLVRGLRPLDRLRQSVAQRASADLSPIDPTSVQTEVRPLIDALNQHTARIERLLSSRRRLITDASHQMRTPLTEMRTQIEYSLRQNRPELSHQTLVDAHADIERLTRLLSQLLLQARADPDGMPEPHSEVVDLTELARQASLDLVAAARKKSIDLSFEARSEPARVVGSAVLLRELVANLVDNAIAYGREGGSVAVRVVLDGGVTLEVEDDGPGIPEAEREKVFERFYRSPVVASAGPPGSGLGLSIVRDIVAAHAAKIDLLTGRSGTGLCVRVSMAAAPDAAKPLETT